MTDKSKQTKLVQAEIGVDKTFGAVSPPLYLSSTYRFEQFDQQGQYDYGRGGNPNRDALGAAIADLEGGAGGIVTSSGMAAIDLVTNLFKADDLIIAPHDCYGGTHRLLTHRAEQGRLRVIFVDQNDPKALDAAIAQQPKLIMIETPSNPLMRLVDIAAICKAAKKVGAQVSVDNTFLSPARQLPLDLGADFVIHSTTKYLNGHSDVIGGCLVAKTAEHAEQLAWWANCTGVTGAPFDSYLTLRGMRTLFARMDIAERNTQAIAKFLHKHKAVEAVYYPGLRSDPGHKLMKRQQSGPGAMLSFTLKGGRDAARVFLENIEVFQMAESLGGVESLICHPATMTHRGMADEAREIAGIGDNLVRLSVGIEAEDDLIAALKNILVQI
ncbi:cystathionine gamma-synthase [Litorimonas sp. RW-G-Af-16]|uniref:cystathionine gamma-synthase n=1 Tax=Litorimonas sp. RW-G-Af-16 TaxID=3241168 RepID=UPI00390CA7B0